MIPPLAVRSELYDVLTVPFGNDVVVTANVAGLEITVICKFAAAVPAGESESVACAVKLYVPVAVVLPWITPAVVSISPEGKLPLVFCQVYGATPPLATNGRL